MPAALPTDDQLDPLEQADLDETLAEEEGAEGALDAEEHPSSTQPAADLDPEIVEEIKRVMVADDELVDDGATVKSKGHMIPEKLISQPLRPEDLWDEDGTI